MKRTHLAAMGLALAVAIHPALAQPSSGNDAGGSDAASAADTPTPAPPAPDPTPTSGGPSASEWNFSVSPYLWLTGVHGTAGAFDRDIGVHASAADLLSHFRFGLMATVEARRKWLVLPLDMVWARLGDNKALPFPNLAADSADFKATVFILTPKVGVRLLNKEMIKADFLTGIRYWHLGQNLKFNPSVLNRDFSSGQNWVDPLVGGRIETALSKKVAVTVFGDVGGWGTGSQLEYQVGGVIGYKIKESWTLEAGYRYLDVDYRAGGTTATVFDCALSGAVLGVTFNIR